MEEIWKDIEGFENRYQVSNTGRIRSLSRKVKFGMAYKIIPEKILTPRINKAGRRQGYLQIALGYRKRFYIHRLIASAFILNPENKPCINHKDGNTLNNNIDNLEWCTYSENRIHSHLMLGAGSGNSFLTLDVEIGVFYNSLLDAYKSKNQPVKLSQFCKMLEGAWPNKTSFIRL